MATVTDVTSTEAGGANEERGADGSSPLPPTHDNIQGDPPSYPDNREGTYGQEMTVIGRSAPLVTEPSVTLIAKDETTDHWSTSNYNYSFPLSTCVSDVYSTFAKETGNVDTTSRVLGGWVGAKGGNLLP